MIENLKSQPLWLAWRSEPQKGSHKMTKKPFRATSTDPATWCTFEQASAIKNTDGVGIVFHDNSTIFGIDLDHILPPQKTDLLPYLTKNLPSVKALIVASNTYTEFSPSKTGLHLLFSATAEDRQKINDSLSKHKIYFTTPPLPNQEKSAIEIYTHGRYFTFSDDQIPGSPPIRTITADEFISLFSLPISIPLELVPFPTTSQSSTIQSSTIQSSTIQSSTIQSLQSSQLTQEEILHKMFSSKNGEKIRSLYNGDLSGHNNDHSSADMALCMHLAFWTQGDPTLITSLWLQSPLAQRNKTQTRKDYVERTISNAISSTTEFYDPLRNMSEKQKLVALSNADFNFIKTEKGVPELLLTNIKQVVAKTPQFENKIRLNDFSHMIETNIDSSDWKPMNDNAVMMVRSFICEHFHPFRKLSSQLTIDAMKLVAFENRINPPKDFLLSLVWDNIPRIEFWLQEAFGVSDTKIYRSIGSNWLKGLAKRVLSPGCQFDEVLALEGEQGWRKSSAIRVLGFPWHVETTANMDNKDFYLTLAQNIIVEFSEGEIFNRNSVAKLKAEVTKTHDQLRPPYESGIMSFPRSCVFAITTNSLDLKDDTGNRRWLPVELKKPADVDWIRENRDQLLAEAVYKVSVLHETTYEYPLTELRELQSGREVGDAFDEDVIDYYLKLPQEKREAGITLKEFCEEIFSEESDPTKKQNEYRITPILRRVLKLKPASSRVDGKTKRVWVPTKRTVELFDVPTTEQIPF